MTKAYQAVCGAVPGHEGCPFVIRDDDEAEVIRQTQRHARVAHHELFSADDVRGILQQVDA